MGASNGHHAESLHVRTSRQCQVIDITPQVADAVQKADLEFRGTTVLLSSEDVSDQIRSPEVTAISSVVAAHPAVRQRLVELQRQIGSNGSIVTEGRDQGSVVFPSAEFKFFLTASVDARARRRHRELVSGGSGLTLATVRSQLRQRDAVLGQDRSGPAQLHRQPEQRRVRLLRARRR